MPTTTNFGWTTPADTDLVKDGAAAIRTLGSGIDTSFLDLKGGTTGQLLSKNSNTDLDYAWIDNTAGAGANWSLLNTGGTALTGAQTITVSGISNKDKIAVIVVGVSSANVSSTIGIRLNADTANNYNSYGFYVYPTGTYAATISEQESVTTSYFRMGNMSGNAGSVGAGYLFINGASSAGLKMAHGAMGFSAAGNNGQSNQSIGGYYNSASSITSVSIFSSSGNLDAGTVYVYTSA